MATTEAAHSDVHVGHGHDADGHDHDHPPFLAHHFDTPEQQFDSGKLGMWIFLGTEVLFFSGMFVAYAIFRMLRPDVFEGCSQFLNTKLGAINTGVLLFSSLTMAWAVRCAQIEEHKKCAGFIAATLSCAMVFLGVKSIEYSHKWELGLLPPKWYSFIEGAPHPEGISKYLLYMALPFAIGLVGLVIWLIKSILTGNRFAVSVAKPLIVVFAFFFVGIGLGMILESGESHAEHGEAHAHADDHASDHVSDAAHASPAAGTQSDPLGDSSAIAASTTLAAPLIDRLAVDQANSGIRDELRAKQQQAELGGSTVVAGREGIAGPIDHVSSEINTRSQAGVFFGIYYVMTGIHAIHILAGIGVLIWLLVRTIRLDFNRHYFGPVDYVGLYWHIVDLIWIYLFPLLYLIR